MFIQITFPEIEYHYVWINILLCPKLFVYLNSLNFIAQNLMNQ